MTTVGGAASHAQTITPALPHGQQLAHDLGRCRLILAELAGNGLAEVEEGGIDAAEVPSFVATTAVALFALLHMLTQRLQPSTIMAACARFSSRCALPSSVIV